MTLKIKSGAVKNGFDLIANNALVVSPNTFSQYLWAGFYAAHTCRIFIACMTQSAISVIFDIIKIKFNLKFYISVRLPI